MLEIVLKMASQFYLPFGLFVMGVLLAVVSGFRAGFSINFQLETWMRRMLFLGSLVCFFFVALTFASILKGQEQQEVASNERQSQRDFTLISELKVVERNDPKKIPSVAAKYHWDMTKNVWQKQMVLYNGFKQPTPEHPIWQYLDTMPKPSLKGGRNGETFGYRLFTN